VMAAVLVDVFLTILYARVGSGFISYYLAQITWKLFRWFSKPFGEKRPKILSFCGPVILVLLVFVWTHGLALGAALIIHPQLGTSVISVHKETPTDFITAYFAGGSSISIVGADDLIPQNSTFRLLYLFNSLVGAALLSLLVTYLLEVYNALQQRNGLAFKVHLLTAETNDAVEMLAGFGPEGHFEAGYTNLADLAAETVHVKEAHHFYSVLFYFRFSESFYSVSQLTLVCLDFVSLVKSTMDDESYAWFKESASIEQMWRACIFLITTLLDNFLPGEKPDPAPPPDEATLNRWHQRYDAALKRLRQANIQTVADEQSGFEHYAQLRNRWEPLIQALAPSMDYHMEDIDPASMDLQSSEKRQDFKSRLYTVEEQC